MNINNVSFGKIVKVNSQVLPAMHITEIINNRAQSGDVNLNKQLKALFPDKKDNNVLMHYAGHDTIYLFSGDDAKKFLKLDQERRDGVLKAMSYFNGSQYSDFYADKANKDYNYKVSELIRGAEDVKEITVETEPDSSNIKSINIMA